jgi:hypothetical protein
LTALARCRGQSGVRCTSRDPHRATEGVCHNFSATVSALAPTSMEVAAETTTVQTAGASPSSFSPSCAWSVDDTPSAIRRRDGRRPHKTGPRKRRALWRRTHDLDHLKGGGAFGADNWHAIEIVKESRARLATALLAEFGFGHEDLSLRGSSPTDCRCGDVYCASARDRISTTPRRHVRRSAYQQPGVSNGSGSPVIYDLSVPGQNKGRRPRQEGYKGRHDSQLALERAQASAAGPELTTLERDEHVRTDTK